MPTSLDVSLNYVENMMIWVFLSRQLLFIFIYFLLFVFYVIVVNGHVYLSFHWEQFPQGDNTFLTN